MQTCIHRYSCYAFIFVLLFSCVSDSHYHLYVTFHVEASVHLYLCGVAVVMLKFVCV